MAQEGCDIVENEINRIINDTDVTRFQEGLGPMRRVIPDPFWQDFRQKYVWSYSTLLGKA